MHIEIMGLTDVPTFNTSVCQVSATCIKHKPAQCANPKRAEGGGRIEENTPALPAFAVTDRQRRHRIVCESLSFF